MTPMRLGCLFAIFGGGCWLYYGIAAHSSGDSSRGLVFYIGAAMLTVAVFGFGIQAVRRSPLWLRVIIGLCAPVFGWMMLLTFYDLADSGGLTRATVNAAVGGLAILVGLLRWGAGRPPKTRAHHARGSHAR